MSTQTRVITVFSTKGKQKAKIETDVTSWGSLKPLLAEEGYDLNSLLATESIGRHDLVNEDAVLPDGEFTVFLRPAKTKSGADVANMSYKELRAATKSAIETGGDAAKDHFNAGKSYTNKSTDDLRELLHDWNASNSTSVGTSTDFSNLTPQEKVDLILQLAQEVSDDSSNNFSITVNVEGEDVDLDAVETEELTKLAEEILAGYKVTLCFYRR